MTKIEGITIEINGETKKLTTAIKNLNTPINRVQNELKNVENLLKMNPGNVELLTRKEKALAQAVTDTKSKLQALEQAQEQANQTIAEGGEVSESQYAKLQSEIDKTRLKLQNLEEAQRSFGSVSAQQLAAVGAKVEDVGNKVSDVGKSFAPVSAAAAGAISVGVKSAMDLETAFTGVAKTVEATPQQLEAITKGIEEMSMRTASSVEDIAAVAEAAGQLGIATDDVLDFTETMIMLGDTTNLTADEAASALAKFANITGTTADNYGRLGAVIVDLGNNFATTEADIVAMATRLAGTGAQIGLTESEIMALAAAMSSVGIEAEAGGTAMTQTFAAMEKAVANGGNKLQQFANIAGVSADEFAAMWQSKPIDAITAFVKGLGDLEGKGESATLVLDEMGLSGIRQSDMLKRLSGAADVMSSAVDTANAAWSENTALTDEAQKKYETAAATFEQVKSALVIAAAAIGDVFLPVLKTVAEALKGMAERFSNLPDGVKKVIAVFLTIAAAIAPVLMVIGSVISKIGMLLTFAPALAGVGAAFSGIALPVLGVVAAIGVLVAAVIAIATHWEQITTFISAKIDYIKFRWVVFTNELKAKWNALVDNIKSIWSGFVGFWSGLWENIKSYAVSKLEALKQTFSNVVENIKSVWNSFVGFWNGLWSSITAVVSKVVSAIIAAFRAAVTAIKSVWGSITGFFSGIVSRIVGVFQSLPGKMVSIGRNMVQGIINGITGAAGALISKMKSLATSALNAAKSALGIHSPSRIMRDVVGKNIVLGISDGIYKNKTNVTDAMKEVSQNILSEAEEILDIQKSLGEISEEQELAYWKNIRNITGLQGEELLAVDKKIAEKEKSILEAQQAEQEKYLQEFASKVDKIAGFSNIFSEVEFEKVSGKDLTKNLQTQVWALEEYSEIMQELAKRGISDALFAELQEQGVGAIDELRALARMSDEELAKYDSLYTEKMQLAAEQAAKEMGIASVGIVDSVAEAVESLNTNASVVVNQAENNQETLLDLIATKVAEYVGNALLSGLVGIQDTILASMPETLNLNLDGKQVAQTMWSPLDRLGDKKNRLFAPTRQQIANIALSVVGKWGE